jgi:hypothetical protein
MFKKILFLTFLLNLITFAHSVNLIINQQTGDIYIALGSVEVSTTTLSGTFATNAVVNAEILRSTTVDYNVSVATGNIQTSLNAVIVSTGTFLKTNGSNAMTGDLLVPNITATYGINISTGIVGSTANFTDFPLAKFISSTGNTGHTYTGSIGLVGEALASVSDTGTGVGGVAKTNGLNQGRGVSGVGKVGATGDLGAAIGVYGRAEDTHAGGKNIGCYGYAVNGSTNYSFYGSAGDIFSNNGDIIISTTTGSKGIVFQDGTKQITAATGSPLSSSVFVSAYNISFSSAILNSTEVFLSTVTLVQAGNKGLEIKGTIGFQAATIKDGSFLCKLYKNQVLIYSQYVHASAESVGSTFYDNAPFFYFLDSGSSSGTIDYCLSVQTTKTYSAGYYPTISGWNWRVEEL